jgi:hypothetical protein
MRFRRWLGVLAGIGLLAGPGGCPPDEPPWQAVPLETDYDFASLYGLTEAVFDLTDVSWGWAEKDILFQRYESNGRELLVERVEELNLEVMLWSEAGGGHQRILLPGTSRLEHLQIDLRGDLVRDAELGIWFHEGFLEAADAVCTLLEPHLKPAAETVVVGYSMGGGVAIIVAAKLRAAGYDIEEVVTCGQPPITNERGAEALADLPLLRMISGNDPVPQWRSGSYVQFGRALILLDGPYVVELSADDPDINALTQQFIDATDLRMLDHGGYPSRTRSKIGTQVYRVELENRDAFLQRPIAESAYWLPEVQP